MVRAKPQYPPSRAAVLPLVGGGLAFDLTNTSSGRGGPHWLEHLQTAAHVVDWARHAKVLTARDASALHRRIAADQRLADALLARMLQLRELIHAIGVAIAATAKSRRADMDALVRLHAECLACARLVPTGATFAWVWNPAASRWSAAIRRCSALASRAVRTFAWRAQSTT
jgi:predicted RNA-binding Zn ribbon-like protein